MIFSDSLGSISAVVKRKEESDILAKYNLEECYNSEENSETETDDEEYPCSVCKHTFQGEANLEKHQRYSHHWG